MDDIAAEYVRQLQRRHAQVNYETRPLHLAADFGIQVHLGRQNMASSGPPPMIMLTSFKPWGRAVFTAHHEIAHILMQEMGFEDELIRQFGSFEEAEPIIERWCDLGAGFLLMPRTLVREVMGRESDAPAIIYALHQQSRASLSAALRRWVYDEPDASRAAFTTSGNYVRDVARHNLWLPFWRYSPLPAHPDFQATARLLTLPGRRALGVLAYP